MGGPLRRRRGWTSSPLASWPRLAKTAAEVLVSTCPAMIAVPVSPGEAPLVCQPTRLVSSPGGGCSCPLGPRDRPVKGASTQILGMRRRTGLDRGRCLPTGCAADAAECGTDAACGGADAADCVREASAEVVWPLIIVAASTWQAAA